MSTRAIPREEWTGYFDTLSRSKIGARVNIEVVDPEAGVGTEARNVILDGLVADIRHGKGSLEIAVETAAGDRLSHLVQAPVRVHMKESDEGRAETLEVEDEAGTRTLLHFRPVTLPAEV